MAWTHNITKWHQTEQGKNRRDKQTRTTNKHQDTKDLPPRSNTVLCKIHIEPVRKNGQYETIAQERNKLRMDHRSKFGL